LFIHTYHYQLQCILLALSTHSKTIVVFSLTTPKVSYRCFVATLNVIIFSCFILNASEYISEDPTMTCSETMTSLALLEITDLASPITTTATAKASEYFLWYL